MPEYCPEFRQLPMPLSKLKCIAAVLFRHERKLILHRAVVEVFGSGIGVSITHVRCEEIDYS
ncbi:hypothetical protein H5410_007269 [Solanum commersonii]|uniref:Uncharacterized protein n=1 Tax=Solanum commersonii TaxID=4109 RepID=A0A9J6ACL4_SOLCO|nr:hypothetical protein H5410_007269 [Solanum commersonii]